VGTTEARTIEELADELIAAATAQFRREIERGRGAA
jgi:hypothetical protein